MVVEIIHDVTVLGGGGQEFCDDATGGREVKKMSFMDNFQLVILNVGRTTAHQPLIQIF